MTRRWLALGVLCLGVLLIGVDGTVLAVATPLISRDLGTTATQMLWIGDIYSFVLAGLLVTMGSLGDRIGHKKLLLSAQRLSALISMATAYAPTAGDADRRAGASRRGRGDPGAVDPRVDPRPVSQRAGTCCGRGYLGVGVLGRYRAGPRDRRAPAGALLVGLGLPDQRPGDRRVGRWRQRAASRSRATRRRGRGTCPASGCRWSAFSAWSTPSRKAPPTGLPSTSRWPAWSAPRR